MKKVTIRALRTFAQGALTSPILAAFLVNLFDGDIDWTLGRVAVISAIGGGLLGVVAFAQNALEVGVGDGVTYERG